MDTLLHAAITIQVAFNVAVFAYAMGHLFDRTSGIAAGMRILAVSAGAASIMHIAGQVLTPRAPTVARVAGIALCAASLWLFTSAARAATARRLTLAFSTDVPGHLIDSGPYAAIRHPFYAAYLLTWIGSSVGAWRPELWIPTIFMGSIYTAAARFEEQKFQRSPLAAEYRSYHARAGMFLPRFARSRN